MPLYEVNIINELYRLLFLLFQLFQRRLALLGFHLKGRDKTFDHEYLFLSCCVLRTDMYMRTKLLLYLNTYYFILMTSCTGKRILCDTG